MSEIKSLGNEQDAVVEEGNEVLEGTTANVDTENEPQVVVNQDPISALFGSNDTVQTNRGNQLRATADLTKLSEMLARDILQEITGNSQEFEDAIVASKRSHDAMDDLINQVNPLGTVNIEFLTSLDEEELEKMLRSQQSKRSRAKAKEPMTFEVYTTMMVAAVAENLLRLAAKKPKNSGGAALGDLGMSDEDYIKLAEDPEELKKAIRNVQSKKSIMKSKQGFSEDNPRWQQLLEQEERLKNLRDQKAAIRDEELKALKEEAEAKRKAEEILAEYPDDPNPEEAKQILDALKDILASK